VLPLEWPLAQRDVDPGCIEVKILKRSSIASLRSYDNHVFAAVAAVVLATSVLKESVVIVSTS